jgi:hypothetical protein
MPGFIAGIIRRGLPQRRSRQILIGSGKVFNFLTKGADTGEFTVRGSEVVLVGGHRGNCADNLALYGHEQDVQRSSFCSLFPRIFTLRF